MSTAVWTGAAPSSAHNAWSAAANWQGDVVPSPGEDIEFPAGLDTPHVNVDTDVVVGNVTFDGSGYSLGAAIQTNTITVDGNITSNGTTETDNVDLVLGHDTTLTVGSSDDFVIGGTVSDGGNAYALTKQGQGELNMTDGTFTGATTIAQGVVDIGSNWASNITVDSGATLYGYYGTAAAITDDGGTVGAVEDLTYPATFTATGDVTLGSGSTYQEDIANYGGGELDVTGSSSAINLTGSTLSVTPTTGFTPTAGTVYTLISNATGSAVTGTFNGLPQGAITTADGSYYQISYDAGESGHDVTLTVVNPPPPPIVVSVTPATTTSASQTALSIVGADPGSGNASDLTYTWSVAHAPNGAKPVTFSVNGTNAAHSSSAVFHKAGTYHLLCTVASSDGESTTQLVSVKVNQLATKLELAPHKKVMAAGAKVQYSGVVLDQFKHAMPTTSITYAVKSGDGTINDSGLFTAGENMGHVVIKMTVDGLTGTVGATIV